MAKRDRNSKRRETFPCAWLELDPGDRGYEEGYRFVVEQIDGDQHFFVEKRRFEQFIKLHRFDVLEYDEFQRLREEMEANEL